jgi:para-aminobenzoate synthetase component 1
VIKTVSNSTAFKYKALQWAAGFEVACLLDSNGFRDKYSKYDLLIAAGAKQELTANAGNAFEHLAAFKAANPGWLFGYLGYDLKNEIESLQSNGADGLNFPDMYFFVPEYVIVLNGNKIEIVGEYPEAVFQQINQQKIARTIKTSINQLQKRFTRDEYIATIKKIKNRIASGDIYVTNFCQEFFVEDEEIDPVAVFRSLNKISPNPFAAFFKFKCNYVLCASPERFLAKRGNKLISQPIKGTAKRGLTKSEDEAIKQELRNQTKELQENVMIVDLVRNDLTRSAQPGSVKTKELFGIYSFSQLHQMISTVICQLADDISDIAAIKNTFPMGSMTGAPKISAMQLMEQYERTKRALYSGTIGYFSPDGDFDFNVVIRSLLYNATTKYLSFSVGSAITYHAEPEKEYEECLLKAKAIMEVLGQQFSAQT